MDVTTVTQLIGSLGFPIVACTALFCQSNKQEERHKTEMEKLSNAVNNNTLAITQLTEKLSLKGE
jgi:hypothetical protein